ncbi:hypothetical protein ACVXHB_24015 [Escherichia coli]
MIIISSEMPELLGITDRILVVAVVAFSGIVEYKNDNANEILPSCVLHLKFRGFP